MPAPEAVIADLVDSLAAFPSVERVILFGSRADGTAAPRSDIDLAVECPEADGREWNRMWTMVDDAETLLEIDFVRLDRAGDDLKASIARYGKVLYERVS